MLPGNVCEAVDDPSRLVEATVAKRIRTASRRTALVSRGDEGKIRLVDSVEDVLPPCNKITPRRDVVTYVGQTLAPCLENHLQV